LFSIPIIIKFVFFFYFFSRLTFFVLSFRWVVGHFPSTSSRLV
jgi:hypothetical protein